MMGGFFINLGLATINLIVYEMTGSLALLFAAGFCAGLAIASLINVVVRETS